MTDTMPRPTMVAGQFYPASPRTLAQAVRTFMDTATVEPAPERVRALVVPHAGYVYSGQTAGFAFRRIEGKRPSRAVLLGCSHRYPIFRASVYTGSRFESPLGDFPVDRDFAHDLAEVTGSRSIEPHLPEHALEVQLPFLHAACGGPVPLVPVLFGSHSPWHADLGKKLAALLDPGDLVLASTDLSHYLSQQRAAEIDARTIEAVLSKDTDAFGRGIDESRYSMCGSTAVICAMAFATAAGASFWQLLDYRTSANASGDCTRVVGYAAISMETV
ncbi:MAG TPA: AmmeMemoRadiSam system protein B [Candidatus Hydrogenedentes bacterium]|jgi:AmmeMemoRadiSam system protein B|nr:AmmeMemoRadiSam system protein B [Candidatus Hydrogenedentota bacterium]MDY0030577.1 AmmeMemoRadiSam system protein B [FCB group bacterium]HNZ18419.1 AmmeMemoRadiSam system protein B [Candidatus Hydrogenedentota bacterium]HOH34189.1 AmmeMemoRadiSam system protein B [Candidatus Hydrogenedentota bacterium]HPA03642.1 AmmeMemoRadiSam system protein B [Candidatus Hydrogenedentota bacterium]